MFVWLLCNCFVPFVPLISSPNCTLFFLVFVNFLFSDFKTILLCHYFISLVSFNNSFLANLSQIINFQHVSFTYAHMQRRTNARSGSRTAATSKMEHFEIIIKGWKPLTVFSKSSILDAVAVLDAPLDTVPKYICMKNICDFDVHTVHTY